MASELLLLIPAFIFVAMLLLSMFLVFLSATGYLRLRRIADTPTSKARSAAIGLAEFSGRAEPAGEPLRARLSGTACVFYRLRFEKFSRFKKKWAGIGIFENVRPFAIDDGTGRIEVDSPEAEFDSEFRKSVYDVFMLKSGKAATDRAQVHSGLAERSSQYSAGPVQDYVLGREPGSDDPVVAAIIVSLPPRPQDAASTGGKEWSGLRAATAVNSLMEKDKAFAEQVRSLGGGELRIIEETVPEGQELYVLGTVVQKPAGGFGDAPVSAWAGSSAISGSKSGAGPVSGKRKSAPHEAGLIVSRADDGILIVSDRSEKNLSAVKFTRSAALFVCGLAGALISLFLLYLMLASALGVST